MPFFSFDWIKKNVFVTEQWRTKLYFYEILYTYHIVFLSLVYYWLILILGWINYKSILIELSLFVLLVIELELMSTFPLFPGTLKEERQFWVTSLVALSRMTSAGFLRRVSRGSRRPWSAGYLPSGAASSATFTPETEQECAELYQTRIFTSQQRQLFPLKEDLADWINRTLGKSWGLLAV